MSVRHRFRSVRPTRAEVVGRCPGDDVVPHPDAVMDRGFLVPASPETVWPWLVQLGKGRAGWYLPTSVERAIPPRRRATRRVEPRWQGLAVGDVVPDWGGRHATFEVVQLDEPGVLVYRSQRGPVRLSWAILLRATTDGASTRVHLRLRLGPLERPWLATAVGDPFDLVTVAGLAAGLRERVAEPRS